MNIETTISTGHCFHVQGLLQCWVWPNFLFPRWRLGHAQLQCTRFTAIWYFIHDMYKSNHVT